MNVERLDLEPADTADFYPAVMAAMLRIGCLVRISVVPNEVAETTPFPDDRTHSSYDTIRTADDPFTVLMASLQSTCDAAADLVGRHLETLKRRHFT